MGRRLPIIMCTAILFNTVRLYGRLRGLDTAAPSLRPVGPDHAFLVATGVVLTEDARRAASAHADATGTEVLDLVPSDLAPHLVVDLARVVDTRTYGQDRFATGTGAFHALLVDRGLLVRAGVEERDDYPPAELALITRKLKRYAPTSTDLAVIPGVHAHRDAAGRRLRARWMAERYRRPLLVVPFIRGVALAVGLVTSPGWGAAAVAGCWLAPFAACAGRLRTRPAEAVRGPATRLLTGPGVVATGIRTRQCGHPSEAAEARAAEARRRRARYHDEIAAGVDNLLEPGRKNCPWCGSTRLSLRVEAGDTVMGKPGRFRYDGCSDCGHIFQNPRLSPAGLEFYYRDAYDGLYAELAEEVFGSSDTVYRARVALLTRHTTPARWLDVGGGHGHFCLAAKGLLPDTTFDALDMGEGIEEAARRRWVGRAYRGFFPDLVDEIAGRYDVISMFHYLEHTRDPYQELDTAAKALAPGGYLVIEVPHAHGPSLRIYRNRWVGLFPPQHQHLIPPDNLVRALAERGLSLVELQFGGTHQAMDAAAAAFFLMQEAQPDPTLPWLPYEATPWRRLRRGLAVTAGTPLVLGGAVVDQLTRPYFESGRRANAYRIVARGQG